MVGDERLELSHHPSEGWALVVLEPSALTVKQIPIIFVFLDCFALYRLAALQFEHQCLFLQYQMQ